MAFHGGALERQTDRIARAAADAVGRIAVRHRAPAPDPPHFPSTDVRRDQSPSLARVPRPRRGRRHDPRLRARRACSRRCCSAVATATLAAHAARRAGAGPARATRSSTDLDADPPRAARPAPWQPGQRPTARRRADRAAATGPRAQAALGRLGRRRASSRRRRAIVDALARRRPVLDGAVTRRVVAVLVAVAAVAGCASDDDGTRCSHCRSEGNTVAPITSPPVTLGGSACPSSSTSTSTTAPGSRRPPSPPRRSATGTAPASTSARSPPSPRSARPTRSASTATRTRPTVRHRRRRRDAVRADGRVVAGRARSPTCGCSCGRSCWRRDVEVLTLDAAGRAAACTDPPPATPPSPAWDDADVRRLLDRAGRHDDV